MGLGPSTSSLTLHVEASPALSDLPNHREHPNPPPDLQTRPNGSAHVQRHDGHVLSPWERGAGGRLRSESEIPKWTITSLHGDFILGVEHPSAEWGRNDGALRLRGRDF